MVKSERNRTALGRELRDARLKLGLSQDELAGFARVHRRTIIAIETGRQRKPTELTVSRLRLAIERERERSSAVVAERQRNGQ